MFDFECHSNLPPSTVFVMLTIKVNNNKMGIIVGINGTSLTGNPVMTKYSQMYCDKHNLVEREVEGV